MKITPNKEKSKPTTTGRRLEERGGERSDSPPCLFSNNSIENQKKSAELSEKPAESSSFNQLSPSHKKTAHTLSSNVERLINVEAESINHVAFLTLTFRENITDHKEAYNRFRSFNSNFLASHPVYGHWISVKEHQARGAWHFHMIVQLTEDIRTGFDFDQYDEWLKGPRKAGTFPTGNNTLRSLWAELGETLDKYGFGRIFTLEPLKSNAEAIKYYVGKYVSKQIGQRPLADKGVRLINYSKGWLKNSVKIAWNNKNSTLWRKKVSAFARIYGFSDFYQLSETLGPRWAYKNYDDIFNTLPLSEIFMPYTEEYASPLIKIITDNQETRKRKSINKLTGKSVALDGFLVDGDTGEVLF